jgi:hypothetical protein
MAAEQKNSQCSSTARTVSPERLRQATYCHLIETGVRPDASTPTT